MLRFFAMPRSQPIESRTISAWQVVPVEADTTNLVTKVCVEDNTDASHVLTMDEARCIASNIAKLPTYLAATPDAANQ